LINTPTDAAAIDAPGARQPRSQVTIVANDIRPVGGMERVLTELIEGLRDMGDQVTVIARTCELERIDGVTFHRVRGPGRPFILAYPWFLVAGSFAVRRWRSGIVQATGAIVLNRVDVIAVHYCHQVGPANPSRSGALFRVQMKLVSLLKRVAERACFRANNSAVFVCVSEGVADEVREHYPRIADRVITIHNGVDTRRFAPGVRREDARAMRQSLEIGDAELVALFVGSEWGRKGLGPAIEALPHAPGWVLVVAGDGDRRRYQQLADSLGVGSALRWLGLTSDVQLAYAIADAFVLPSAYETFSLVTFEAAASGLPVLCTAVSGVRELIRDGENGFFISRDPRQIAGRLVQLAADPDLRSQLGQSARGSALNFSWQTTVGRHHELYRRIAAEANV
jgi:UDP-glucose:(heptosyl)LPS alpha-1,3-glucosyltransferase